MASNIPPRLKRLHEIYTDQNSSVFLTKNINKLMRFAKTDPNTAILSRSEILQYQQTLSDISRDREARILRNRKRHLSFRRWRTFAPGQILLGDLAFIRPISNPIHGKPIIMLILIDSFSRMAYTALLKNSTSLEVTKHLDKAIIFFNAKYKLFCSDRVSHIFPSVRPSVRTPVYRPFTCPSVRPSVCPPVRPSIGSSVCRSVALF